MCVWLLAALVLSHQRSCYTLKHWSGCIFFTISTLALCDRLRHMKVKSQVTCVHFKKKLILSHWDLDLWPKVTNFNRVRVNTISSRLAKTASKSVHPFGWNSSQAKSRTHTHTHTQTNCSENITPRGGVKTPSNWYAMKVFSFSFSITPSNVNATCVVFVDFELVLARDCFYTSTARKTNFDLLIKGIQNLSLNTEKKNC